MRIFFADDSRQRNPSRIGLSPIVGIGGFSINIERLKSLEASLDRLCVETGFPRGERFKWSPERGMWMYENLIGDSRRDFYLNVIAKLGEHDAIATVIVSENDCGLATRAETHELDVTNMFIERSHNQLRRLVDDGIVMIDRPGGDRRDEDTFLASCVDTLISGTEYVRPDRFGLNVLAVSSKYYRCLQASDVIASSTISCIAGETNYSPPIFDAIRTLLDKNFRGTSGGTGLKLHPDRKLMNLYHWLLRETQYSREAGFLTLPHARYIYFADDGIPRVAV